MRELVSRRPLLADIGRGRERVEEALDAERRGMMRANERRLEAYLDASKAWAAAWPALAADMEGLPLETAHAKMIARAAELLPTRVAAP